MNKTNSSLETSACFKEYHYITAHQSWYDYIKEIISYRELFYFLIWRDVLIRYKQTALGISWALIRPLLIMIILTGVFQKIAQFSSVGVPYFLVVLTALVPWQFFCDAVLFGTNSLLVNEQLISRVYFPRILIPASCVISSFLDCIICFIFLLINLLFSLSTFPSFFKIGASILFLAWNIIFSLALTSFLAALIVRYRDVRYVVPFLMQIGIYISPIGFHSSHIPGVWRVMYSLNPMVGIIDAFRWALLNEPFYYPSFIIGIGITMISLVITATYFRKAEKLFADVI